MSVPEQRRSVPSRQLGEPGPDPAQLYAILGDALRVPDHGRLAPFRILAIQGDSRVRLGEFFAKRALERDPEAPAAVLEKERGKFSFAPQVLVVIAKTAEHPKVPKIEQILSAGCVAFGLLQAAQRHGFGAQWLTGWGAYDEAVAAHLGLGEGESIIGFVHIGTAAMWPPERQRPAIEDHFSVWNG
jgi:nitroreductase